LERDDLIPGFGRGGTRLFLVPNGQVLLQRLPLQKLFEIEPMERLMLRASHRRVPRIARVGYPEVQIGRRENNLVQDRHCGRIEPQEIHHRGSIELPRLALQVVRQQIVGDPAGGVALTRIVLVTLRSRGLNADEVIAAT
jgi:hypothetical protein